MKTASEWALCKPTRTCGECLDFVWTPECLADLVRQVQADAIRAAAGKCDLQLIPSPLDDDEKSFNHGCSLCEASILSLIPGEPPAPP